MSVCIAAHAFHDGQQMIVLCWDWQVGDDMSTWEDPEAKFCELNDSLVCLCAGVLEDAHDLRSYYRKRLTGKELSLSDLKEQLFLGMKDFKSDLERCGRESGTNAQFLVCGYVDGEAIILYANESTITRVTTYNAIGVGADCAHAMLRWRKATDQMDGEDSNLNNVIYSVFEAKSFGALSPHVGKEATDMIVIAPGEHGYRFSSITPEHLDFLFEEFEVYGPKPLDPNRVQFPDFPKFTNEG